MRNLKHIYALVIVLLTLTSCSNNDDNDGGPITAGNGTLVAKVDGANFQSLDISSSATVANAGSGLKNLVIIASNSDGNAFAITIFGYDGPGTYELTGANAAVTNIASYTETDVNLSNPTASTTEIWQAPYDDTKVGEVIISEETASNVTGSFNFSGKNVNGDGSVKSITEGSFNLSKQTT
ncbi:DUF6252 family protein [Hyunsoonleella pacifica]|uniref:Uncharacterized protein n=1 Tax=Hyunsoonleella pacifica TaxID=1080224 RepID=A0A4Q9FNU0_9FLAO|nr:DUF6252 family protein [Hyunsoonleella pacifica]TBN14319.1 hypothetical protein EYD46_12135 [Hyunsoonleella pacifica]GGD12768.1 hypothetical protein GCM10011368_13430 [Hyunsoonleella pacifica]